MKYLKDYKLFEISFFFNSIDEDNPGKSNFLICFSKDEKYEIKGYTHGKLSHAIKHLVEFKKEFVNSLLDKAIVIAKESSNVVLRNIKNDTNISITDPNYSNNSPNFMRNAMKNTFDMINDKIKNDIKLTEDEKKMRPLLYELQIEYDKIIENIEKNMIDVDKISDVEYISELINQKKTLKFTATYKLINGANIYIINFENSALISKKGKYYCTVFIIDKKEDISLERIKSYINKNMIVKNEALKKALEI